MEKTSDYTAVEKERDQKIKVLITDDHTMMREGLCKIVMGRRP